MNFNRKYEMLNLIVDPEILRLVGREIDSGMPVVVHLLMRGYTAENNGLLRTIYNLRPELRSCILETGEYQRAPFVITQHMDESLPDWLKANSDKSAVESNVTAANPEQHADSSVVLQTSTHGGEIGHPEPPGSKTVGEFTKLFGASRSGSESGSEDPPAPATVQAGPTPQPTPLEENAPGEFTRHFFPRGISVEPPSQGRPTPVPHEPRPLFEKNRPIGDAGDVNPPVVSGHSVPPEPLRESPPVAERYERRGTVNPLAIVERWGSADPLAAAPAPPPVYYPVTQAAGPGDYTQMIQPKTALPGGFPGTRLPVSSQSEIPAREGSFIPLVVVMLALLLLSVVLILVFAMRA